MPNLFISHSSADSALADELADMLAAAGYATLFLASHPNHGIPPGADWQGHLQRKLAEADAMVALLSPAWLASFWCHVEFGVAWNKSKLVIPLKTAPCDLPDILARIQAVDATAGLAAGMPRLLAALRSHGLEASSLSPLVGQGRAPYPGIASFEEADAPVFFGRTAEIRALVGRLGELAHGGPGGPRLLVLVGPSGGGKSSLLKAGLLVRLRKDPAQWRVLPAFRPGTDPLARLGEALAQASGSPAAGAPEAVEIVAVDQLEELFARADPHAATAFLTTLRHHLGPGRLAVATLRAGLLGELQAHPLVIDPDRPLRLAVEPVEPLRRAAFEAVIRGPARLAGIDLEDELVGALVADAVSTDSLPLLAAVLRELWEVWRDQVDHRPLTLDRYRVMGRLEGAVERAAAAAFRDRPLDAGEQAALRRAFVPGLVRRSVNGELARIAAPLAALPAAAHRALRHLVEKRLLVAGRDATGAETVEVAHEALFRTWPLLRAWLEADAALLELDARLEAPEREWLAAGRGETALLPDGPLLTLAAELRGAAEGRLSAERLQLVDASLTARDARQAAAKAEHERLQAAYGLAIDTGDRFIVGLAERMRRLPGVPVGEVELALGEGERFFADMVGRVGETPGLERSIARMQLSFAETSLHTGNTGKAAARAVAGRDRLILGREALVPTAMLRARSFEIEAADALARGRPADAATLLGQALGELSPLDPRGDPEILARLVGVRSALALALIASGNRAAGAAQAQHGLEMLAAELGRSFERASCLRVLALSRASRDEQRARDLDLALSELARAAAAGSRLPGPALLKATIIHDGLDAWRPPEEQSARLEEGLQLTAAVLADDPLDARAREIHAKLRTAQGRSLVDQGRGDEAVAALRAAAGKWQGMLKDNPDRADWSAAALDAAIGLGEQLSLAKADQEAVEVLRRAQALLPDDSGQWRQGSAGPPDLVQAARIALSLGQCQKRLKDGAVAFEALNRAIGLSSQVLGSGEGVVAPEVRQAARRIRAHALWSLPLEPDILPESTRLDILRTILSMLEDAAAADPRMWWFKAADAAARAQLGRALLASSGGDAAAFPYLLAAGAALDPDARRTLSELKDAGRLDNPDPRYAKLIKNISSARTNQADRYEVRVSDKVTGRPLLRPLYVRDIHEDNPFEDELYRLDEYEGVILDGAMRATFAERFELSLRNGGYIPLKTLFAQAKQVDSEVNLRIYRAFQPIRALAAELASPPADGDLSPPWREELAHRLGPPVLDFIERFGIPMFLTASAGMVDAAIRPTFLRLAAQLKAEAQDADAAKTLYMEALKGAQSAGLRATALVLLDLARLDAGRARYEDALAQLGQLVALAREQPDLLAASATTLRAIAFAPGFAPETYSSAHVVRMARTAILLALEQRPQDPELHFQLGDLLGHAAGLPGADPALLEEIHPHLHRAVELAPGDNKYLARLATYFERTGSPEEAKKWWQQTNAEHDKYGVKHASNNVTSGFDMSLMDEMVVIILKGNNAFCEPIWNYIKLSYRNLIKLRNAISGKENFLPSDFGMVLASGHGEPSEEVWAWMMLQHGLIEAPKPRTGSSNGLPAPAQTTPSDTEADAAKWQEIQQRSKEAWKRSRQASEAGDFSQALEELQGLLQLYDDPAYSTLALKPYKANLQASIAYTALFARQFPLAREMAQVSILASGELLMETNLAHALMFLGEADQARAIYLRHRGRALSGNNTWEQETLADLAKLRAAGLEHPLMAEIQASFTSPPPEPESSPSPLLP